MDGGGEVHHHLPGSFNNAFGFASSFFPVGCQRRSVIRSYVEELDCSWLAFWGSCISFLPCGQVVFLCRRCHGADLAREEVGFCAVIACVYHALGWTQASQTATASSSCCVLISDLSSVRVVRSIPKQLLTDLRIIGLSYEQFSFIWRCTHSCLNIILSAV